MKLSHLMRDQIESNRTESYGKFMPNEFRIFNFFDFFSHFYDSVRPNRTRFKSLFGIESIKSNALFG
jgi:hypothetical protein